MSRRSTHPCIYLCVELAHRVRARFIRRLTYARSSRGLARSLALTCARAVCRSRRRCFSGYDINEEFYATGREEKTPRFFPRQRWRNWRSLTRADLPGGILVLFFPAGNRFYSRKSIAQISVALRRATESRFYISWKRYSQTIVKKKIIFKMLSFFFFFLFFYTK